MTMYVIVLFLLLAFFFVVIWLLTSWASLSYDEIIYHLKVPLNGANPSMVSSAVVWYALPAVLLTIAAIVMVVVLRKKEKTRRVIIAWSLIVAMVLGGYGAFWLQYKTGFFGSLVGDVGNSDDSSFIKDHYVDPGEVELVFPEKKRNLIYIFLESTEMTYADRLDGGAFEQNRIPELTKLARENINFSESMGTEPSRVEGIPPLNGAVSLPGTDWTMGGMFAQTAGIPLKIALTGDVMVEGATFFPTVVTLGDILKEQGYRQVLAIGSDAAFGGRNIYFSLHGDYEIHDYYYDIEQGRIPEDYFVWWGIEDEKLFEYARQELTELAAEGQPFNYTMLTVDTHFEDGYLCRLCGDEYGEDQYSNVITCSDRQVSQFVRWIQEQDFYENTTIILNGDHNTMDSNFCENVPEDYQRKTFTAIIHGAEDTVQAYADGNHASKKHASSGLREFATVDLFPTTLAALGVKIPGNRLGVGVNLFSDEKTLLEEYGIERCDEEFRRPSKFLEDLSGSYTSDIFYEREGNAGRAGNVN